MKKFIVILVLASMIAPQLVGASKLEPYQDRHAEVRKIELEITNVRMCDTEGDCFDLTPQTDSDDQGDQVIHSGDATGKMIPIQGGQSGQELLDFLNSYINSDDPMDQARGELAMKLVLQRWFEMSQK